ncbi:MAG TPA: hypothetical protein VG603_14745 [Chitinophagales bacterium]|nr:hypothetical protein [Chitinophagales bacterium]
MPFKFADVFIFDIKERINRMGKKYVSRTEVTKAVVLLLLYIVQTCIFQMLKAAPCSADIYTRYSCPAQHKKETAKKPYSFMLVNHIPSKHTITEPEKCNELTPLFFTSPLHTLAVGDNSCIYNYNVRLCKADDAYKRFCLLRVMLI